MRTPTPAWPAVIDKDGKLRLEARDLFTRYLRTLKNQAVTLIVRKLARPKSRSQTGYWWAVVIPMIAEEFGYHEYEREAVHDAVMRKLRGLQPEPNPLGLRVSMAAMTHEEVSALIEEARHWMLTEHGCVIPDAHKVEAA